MAKKIRIDFSKTKERSSWNTRQIPSGIYKAKVVSVKETEAQDGTAMLVYGLQPTHNRFRTRLFPYYCKLQQNQLWKLRDLLVAAGETIPKKAVSIDPNKVVGRTVAIEVEDDTWEGKVRSQVEAVYSENIVDEDSDLIEEEPQEDDLEDEFEDEEDLEDDFDEDDEDEEFEDDEDDLDDFDDDEEEDDFDEEDDLEEDDFDDEEEEEEEPEPEPEPAPKARAKKRVVRKRK